MFSVVTDGIGTKGEVSFAHSSDVERRFWPAYNWSRRQLA